MAFSFIGGPLIGGLLTDHVGWRWVFLVNVPLGIAAIAIVARVLPAGIGRQESRETPLDLAGILTLTASVGAVLVGLNQHLRVPDWTDPRTGGLVVVGVVGLLVLLAVERRAAAPIIPLRLLTQRVTGRLLAAGATCTFGLYACVMLLPRYFQTVRDVSATQSGVLIYPLLVGLLLAVNVGAAVIVRRGSFRGTLLVGNGLVALGALGFLALDDGSSVWRPLVLMAVLGAGLGPALSGLQIAMSRAVEPRDLGAAMGTLLLGRQVGGALALAAAEAAYSGRLEGGATASAATGWGVFVVAACGAGLAAIALAGLRRSETRLAPPATPTGPAAAPVPTPA